MNKHLIVIVTAMLLLVVGLSGCTDIDFGEVTQFSITTFNVEPSLIEAGDTANLSWVVMSAQIISIDNGIGNVSNIGDRIIMPTETTIYTLIAKNGTKTITATTEIIVKNNTDNNQSPIENPTATIVTSMGTIKVELFKNKVPNTVDNFIKLANDGFYDGLVFHRVIDDFMIQGGGFTYDGTNKESPYGAINLEINPEIRHVDGAIAMARTSDPNSATSQFFINDGPQPDLEPRGVDHDGYAAFGVVIEGIEIVRAIASVDTVTKNNMQNWPVDDVIINSITIEDD